VYKESSPSISCVRKWAKLIKLGRLNINDGYREGRPTEAITPTKVALIEKTVTENPRIKVEDIVEEINISIGSVFTILHENLGMKKLCSKWIPKLLNDQKRLKRLECSKATLELIRANRDHFFPRLVTGDETWVHLYDRESRLEAREWHHTGSPPTKRVRPEKSAAKTMATVFWDAQGILLLDFLPIGTTMNGEYYAGLLRELRQKIKEKRRGLISRGSLLLEDNARPHVSKLARAAGLAAGFTYIDHPPYSPDLAPSDYFLFSNLKKSLRGTKFLDLNQAKSAVVDFFDSKDKSFFKRGIEQLESNFEKCIDAEGCYFD